MDKKAAGKSRQVARKVRCHQEGTDFHSLKQLAEYDKYNDWLGKSEGYKKVK